MRLTKVLILVLCIGIAIVGAFLFEGFPKATPTGTLPTIPFSISPPLGKDLPDLSHQDIVDNAMTVADWFSTVSVDETQGEDARLIAGTVHVHIMGCDTAIDDGLSCLERQWAYAFAYNMGGKTRLCDAITSPVHHRLCIYGTTHDLYAIGAGIQVFEPRDFDSDDMSATATQKQSNFYTLRELRARIQRCEGSLADSDECLKAEWRLLFHDALNIEGSASCTAIPSPLHQELCYEGVAANRSALEAVFAPREP